MNDHAETVETITQKQWKTHAKSVERSVVYFCFVSRIPRLNKRRTRNKRYVFIILKETLN